MTNLSYISETLVRDGDGTRLVRPGDSVTLIPPELRGLEHSEASYSKFQLAVQSYKDHIGWLNGEGPYVIDQMVLWGCGRVMLYLTSGGGYYAKDFMAV